MNLLQKIHEINTEASHHKTLRTGSFTALHTSPIANVLRATLGSLRTSQCRAGPSFPASPQS